MLERTSSNAPGDRLRAERPTRDADRNRDLVDRHVSGSPLLPSLDDGVTLLDVEGGRGVPVLQSLVLDHLLASDGPAFWVDADGHATTASLARIAPSRRLLDRIHVARGFTAYQHYGAVCDLPAAANRHIRRSADGDTVAARRRRRRDAVRQARDRDEEQSPYTPSIIVAPAVDAQYRADDALEDDARTLQARALARLASYAEGYDVPVLVTRTAADGFAAPVENAADHRLECEQTRMGPRFVGDEFETLVYPVDGGAYYQTTLAYWRRLLDARAEQVGLEPASPSTPTNSPEDVGTGVTADGTTAPLTADPLLDAWTGTAGAGGR